MFESYWLGLYTRKYLSLEYLIAIFYYYFYYYSDINLMCTINIGSEQEELDMKRSHMRQTFMTAPKTNTTTSFFGKMYFNGGIIIIVVLSKLVRYVQSRFRLSYHKNVRKESFLEKLFDMRGQRDSCLGRVEK